MKYKVASTSKQKNQLSSEVKLLLWISFGLWIYSLLGIGFYAGSESTYGWVILLLGTFGGWFAGEPFFSGFAVYANYFYLFALFRLTFGNKIPTTSVKWMLALASLTVLLKEVMINEEVLINGAGRYASIDAWGWGAIWWGLSLITLTIATYTQNGRIPLKKSLPITASIYAIVILPLLVLFGYQYRIANEQEKATYFEPGILGIDLSEEEKHNSETPNPYSALRILLTGGTAFSVNSFSHIKYTPAPTLPENSVLQINGNIDFTNNWSLMVDDLTFHLPSTFVHQGKLYQHQDSRHTFFINNDTDASWIKVAPFTNKIDYTLNLLPTQQKGKYRFTITDENKQNTFFQADMIKSGDYTYPFHSLEYYFDKSKLLLDKPIEVSNKCPHQTSMTIEDTHIALSVNNTNYIIVAENENMDEVKKQFQKYRIDDAYCSEKIVILPAKVMKTVNNHLSTDVENIIFLVFDKQNMQLIDEFNLYNNIYYQKHEQNKELTLKTIKPIIEHRNNLTFTYKTRLQVKYLDYSVEL
ncbi:MAG: hypothetical protein IJR46_04470 [Neisseriaceae bacterium]|nr:hypothetical protein [Neisseriaceae bacterium]